MTTQPHPRASRMQATDGSPHPPEGRQQAGSLSGTGVTASFCLGLGKVGPGHGERLCHQDGPRDSAPPRPQRAQGWPEPHPTHPKGPLVRARPRTGTRGTTVPYSAAAAAGTPGPTGAERLDTDPDARQPGTGGRHRGATAPRCHTLDQRPLELVTGQARCGALGGVSRAGGGCPVDAGQAWPATAPRHRSQSHGVSRTRPMVGLSTPHPRPESRRSPRGGAGGGSGPPFLADARVRRRRGSGSPPLPDCPGAACSPDRAFPDG